MTTNESDTELEVLLEKHAHIATITLNRPHRGNACTENMGELLAEIWREVSSDPWIRCVIVTGSGDRHFCTGSDLEDEVAGLAGGGYGRITQEVRLTARQNDVWKPVICAVNGLVAGGGLHFVVDADIVVASKTASFLDTHVNVGMVGAIENIGLAKRLPLGTALRMTLQGRNFRLSAERAFQLGLVDELVSPDEVMETALTIAGDICQNSPNAVSLSQRAVWSSVEMPYSQAVEYGYTLLRMHWSHPDYKEGPAAFEEKREPRWFTGEKGIDPCR